MKTGKTLFAYGTFLALLCLLPAFAFPQTPFYEGKTITIVAPTEAGGTADMRIKAVVSVLKKYIPGNPAIVIEYMPGGGGRKAANYIYKVSRPDGFTIGNIFSGTVAFAVLGEPGVQYDVDRFIYVGSADTAVQYIFLSRKQAGLNNLEKLRSTPGVRLASRSVGAADHTIVRAFAYLLGITGPKFVTGYGGPEMDLALMRGEVDARAQTGDALMQRTPDWVEGGLVDFHASIEIPKGHKEPRFAHLPELESFAGSAKERRLLAMIRGFRQVGSPYILPPGTPKEPVQILQEAMRRAFKDAEFYREYKRLSGGEATPLMPETLENAIKDLPREPDVIDLFKKLSGADPLPRR